MNVYFDNYLKAVEYAFILTKIDQGLSMSHSSFITEIGQCSCLLIEDDQNRTINRLFYDRHLYEIQPIFVRG